MVSHVLADFDRAAASVQALLDGLSPDQLGRPTPCEAWDVRALVNHLIAGFSRFTDVLRGAPPPKAAAMGSEQAGDQLGADPGAAFRAAVAEFRAAVEQPGVADRTYPSPVGEVPADFLVQMRINELLVHGWDLARALGLPTTVLPEDLAARALAMWRARMRQVPRQPGSPFGPEQPAPDDAPAVDRLAAFLGRSLG